MGLRDKFLGATVPEKLVETRHGKVLVIGLTVGGRSELQAKVLESDGLLSGREALIIACAHDPRGRKPLFGWDDLEAVKAVPADDLEPVVDAIVQLTPGSEDELEKN